MTIRTSTAARPVPLTDAPVRRPSLLLLWFLSFLAAGSISLVLLTGAFESQAGAAPVSAPKVVNNTWYDLSEDGRTLTLTLPDYRSGCTWKLGKSNEETLRTVSWGYDARENRVITLAPAEPGAEVVLTMTHIRNVNDPPLEKKTLRVRVDEEGRIRVRSAKET